MRSLHRSLGITVASLLLASCGNNSTSVPPVTGAGFPYTSNGAFYKDYTGPQRPAIAAVGAGGAFQASTQNFVLIARMAGPVFTGGPNYYVWGFDRGGATNNPFPDEPNVKFNAVAVVTADPANGTALTASVTLLPGGGGLPATATLIAADTIQLTVPASSLPSTGAALPAYLWNLWPRSGLGGSAAAQIGSFIPDNAMGTLSSI